jgi:carbon storage regulator
MLVLSRRSGESITIGEDIVVTVVAIGMNQVRIGITAPSQVRVLREEIYRALQDENRASAEGLRHLGKIDGIFKRWQEAKNEEDK